MSHKGTKWTQVESNLATCGNFWHLLASFNNFWQLLVTSVNMCSPQENFLHLLYSEICIPKFCCILKFVFPNSPHPQQFQTLTFCRAVALKSIPNSTWTTCFASKSVTLATTIKGCSAQLWPMAMYMIDSSFKQFLAP